MCPFHNAICMRVIPQDLNVVNVVVLAQIIRGFYECGAIVCDNFTKSAPLAKNIKSLMVFMVSV